MGNFPVIVTINSIEGHPKPFPILNKECKTPCTTWRKFLKMNKINLNPGVNYSVVSGAKKSYSLDEPIKTLADTFIRKRKFSVRLEIETTIRMSTMIFQNVDNDSGDEANGESSRFSTTTELVDNLSQMSGDAVEVGCSEDSKIKNDAIKFLRENVPARMFGQIRSELQQLKEKPLRVFKWRHYSEKSATLLDAMFNV